MTREEAIAILEVSKHMATSGRMYNQAIDMAIEALSAPSGDLISRADAVNTLETEKRCTDRAEDVSGLTLAKFLISALPSSDAEWIPCSERLPLVGGEFLVTLVDNDGTWVSTAQWNMTFGGRWQDIFPNDGYRDISNVIAWMPLPTPYGEDGEV